MRAYDKALFLDLVLCKELNRFRKIDLFDMPNQLILDRAQLERGTKSSP
jgi:hypothetical protein